MFVSPAVVSFAGLPAHTAVMSTAGHGFVMLVYDGVVELQVAFVVAAALQAVCVGAALTAVAKLADFAVVAELESVLAELKHEAVVAEWKLAHAAVVELTAALADAELKQLKHRFVVVGLQVAPADV